jgi:asparagine synthase (glutamine-hydrolysing)
MCGLIANIGYSLGRSTLDRMEHRGPDGAGLQCFQMGNLCVELGHRRLAIIDLDPRANQPMASFDGRFVIVFNGEIYNYLELRGELEAEGFRFRTQSDTEVLLIGYAARGSRIVQSIVGMFAFVILDREERRLFAGRDPFGIKPLYYVRNGHGVSFASEITPLLDCRGVRRAMDPQRSFEYLRFGFSSHGDGTLFADVRQVPAAHVVKMTLDQDALARGKGWRMERYWAPRQDRSDIDLAEAAKLVQETFVENVRLHLRSDVPVAVTLSGGIDSSSIVCAMRAVAGQKAQIHAFNFTTQDSVWDESRQVKTTVERTGVHLHSVEIEPAQLADDVDDLIRTQEEPFGSTSVYAQYRVMRMVRANSIKVVLSGQGADETFAGYQSYLAARLATLFIRGQWATLAHLARCLLRRSDLSVARLGLQALGLLASARTRALGRRLVGETDSPRWLQRAWFAERGVLLGYDPPPTEPDELLHGRLRAGLQQEVLPALLRYEDRNSMAFSVESRVPFLTTRLVDLAYSLPDKYLIDSNGTGKHVLREAMRGLVPDAVLNQPEKVAFNTPEGAWLAALKPWAENVLGSAERDRFVMLDLPRVRALFHHRAGRRALGFQPWRWLNFMRWATLFDVTPA